MNTQHSQRYWVYRPVIILTICAIMVTTSFQPTVAGDIFGISMLGRLSPETTLEDTEANLSTSQLVMEISVGPLDLEYIMTSFSWNGLQALPFGDGQTTPWQRLHQVSADVGYLAQQNTVWGYFGRMTGEAACENDVDDAYLKARALGGLRYTVQDDRVYLMAGGGLTADDFATAWMPVGGLEWHIGYGFKLSLIYPMESELSFTSKNDRLSIDLNILNGYTDIEYVVMPELHVVLRYDENDTVHRLSKESVVEPLQERTYLEVKERLVYVGVNYSPLKNLTCDVGATYTVHSEMTLLDDEEEQLRKYTIDPTIGGVFGMTYAF